MSYKLLTSHSGQISATQSLNGQLLNTPPLLSIIIPAYNEEARLPASLDCILDWLEQQPFDAEILIVENGSCDGTNDVARRYAHQHHFIHLLHSIKGKGAAVRTGMLAGRGSYLFICDSDLSMPIQELDKFLHQMVNCDIAIGSREASGAVRYDEPTYRHLMGRVFNLLVRVATVPDLSDTQCGFKLFARSAARQLFRQQRIDGWTFDVEILYLALRNGYVVKEIPIDWHFDADSRVAPLRDTIHMLSDIFLIRWNDWRGRYSTSNAAPDRVNSVLDDGTVRSEAL